MTVRIMKNLPIPAARSKAKYPWDKLKVGESFEVAGTSNGQQLCHQATRTRTPKKFESRRVNNKTIVWRTQ